MRVRVKKTNLKLKILIPEDLNFENRLLFMKKYGSLVRNKLLEYLEVRDIYELANIDEMGEELQKRMKEGKVILDKLKQCDCDYVEHLSDVANRLLG